MEIDLDTRIQNALDIAYTGQYGGVSHKMWVIDQMVRALNGCEDMQEETEEYTEWVAAYCRTDGGDQTYMWDTGRAP